MRPTVSYYCVRVFSTRSDAIEGGGDDEDVQSLRFMQWTVTQFCMSVIDRLVPCLKCCDETHVAHAVALLQALLGVLRESVDQEALWVDQSPAAAELVSCK